VFISSVRMVLAIVLTLVWGICAQSRKPVLKLLRNRQQRYLKMSENMARYA
jgi:hypothetical protein